MGRFAIADRDLEPRLSAVDRMTGISGRLAEMRMLVPG